MKSLVLSLFLIFSTVARADNFDRYARQLKELDSNYKVISTFCTNLNLAAAVKTVCETELQSRIVLEIKDRLNGLVNSVIDKAGKDYDAEQAELKCKAEALVEVAAINAKEPNAIIVTNQTCMQIKVLISDYWKAKEASCKATALAEVATINTAKPGAIPGDLTAKSCDQINKIISDYKALNP